MRISTNQQHPQPTQLASMRGAFAIFVFTCSKSHFS